MASDERKTQVVNLRMRPAVKDLLRTAAERDHRTLSNMLEVLIVEHCERLGITAEAAPPEQGKSRSAKVRRQRAKP